MKTLLNKGSKVNRKVTNAIAALDSTLGAGGYYLKLEPSNNELVIRIKKKKEIEFSSVRK